MIFFTHRTIFTTFILALALQCSAWSKDTFPMRQGLHEWPVQNGKMTAVVATYQDTNTFRRSYSFYFKTNDQEAWNQVPLVRTSDDLDFSPESAGSGDETFADGVIVFQSPNIYFVYADKRAGKGGIAVTWFKFIQSDNAHPDKPGYYFKPVFTRNYAKNSRQSVDEVLTREVTLKPLNRNS